MKCQIWNGGSEQNDRGLVDQKTTKCFQAAGASSDMGSEHYCLRWNNHQSNLLGVFSQLLHDESLVDVTLACSEGTSIRAHKVVLSACSSYFQSLFVDHPSRHPIVILKDVRFAELRTLVEFMYKGEVNVEYCQLSALLKTAESLKVKGLAEMTTVSASASAQSAGNAGNGTSSASSALASATRAAIIDDQNDVAQDLAPARPPSEPAPALTRPPSASPPRASPLLGVRRARHEPPIGATSSPHRPLSQGPPHRDRPQHRQRSPPSPLEQRASPPHHHTAKEEPPDRDEEMRTSSPDDDMSSVHSNGGHSDNIGINMSISTNMNSTLANAELRLAGLAGLPGLPGLSGRHTSLALAAGGHVGGHLGGHSHLHGAAHPLLGASHPLLRAEPVAGPSGLPPVQQVPLSLKKEVDWERSTDDKSGGESSSDYRLSHESPCPEAGCSGRGAASDSSRSSTPLALWPPLLALHACRLRRYLSDDCLAWEGRDDDRRCAVCLAAFPTAWLLERHAALQHTPLVPCADDKPFVCDQCGQSYRYRSAYVKHREQNHRARLPADKLFTCDVCGMQFRYLKSFKKHRLNHALERLHTKTGEARTETGDGVSSSNEVAVGISGEMDLSIPRRRRRDKLESEAEGPHAKREREDEETADSEVGESIGREDSEDTETREEPASEERSERAEESPKRSGVCFASVSSMADSSVPRERTERTEREEPSGRGASLLGYIGGEAERQRERRFACPFCGKCVRSKENLKLHVRKHTGERPFVCLFCGRAFGGKSDLTRHLRIHTGERPYHCEACGKCFARADYLSKHLTTHVHNAR